ncbi:unnamed protein product [Ilex paraguariensis]|uniref:Uncharacterized protein n=1 Tax=Ilex paraguariensis TaxID=185542 RepID=A0ABC8SAK6_9AQUA
MADTRGGGGVVCNDRCGCPSPCPGGIACKCRSSETATGDDPNMQHRECSCGKHCGCNPCTCSKSVVSGPGKDFCKCGKDRPFIYAASETLQRSHILQLQLHSPGVGGNAGLACNFGDSSRYKYE